METDQLKIIKNKFKWLDGYPNTFEQGNNGTSIFTFKLHPKDCTVSIDGTILDCADVYYTMDYIVEVQNLASMNCSGKFYKTANYEHYFRVKLKKSSLFSHAMGNIQKESDFERKARWLQGSLSDKNKDYGFNGHCVINRFKDDSGMVVIEFLMIPSNLEVVEEKEQKTRPEKQQTPIEPKSTTIQNKKSWFNKLFK